jgi:hypothetical protein
MFVFSEFSKTIQKNKRRKAIYDISIKVVFHQKFNKNNIFLSGNCVMYRAYFSDVYRPELLIFLKTLWWNGVTLVEKHPPKNSASNS